VVEKIWNFDISELFLWIFWGLGTLLELFFKNQESNYEIRDYGLILEKPSGFFAKLPELSILGLFLRGKSRGLGPQARDHVRPRSTMDRCGAAKSAMVHPPEHGA
jgi:hypothetical protein